MKNKLLIGCLALVTLVVIGATTMRVSDYPNRAVPVATDMFLLASTIDHTNYYTTYAQLMSAIGAITNGLQTTNIFVTNVVAGNIFAANLAPNTVLYSDASKLISSILNGGGALTNDGAGVVGWDSTIVGSNAIQIFIDSALTNFASTNIALNATNSSFTNIMVQGAISNMSLTADTVIKANSSRVLASIANGSGILTNDGSGGFAWVPGVSIVNNTYVTNLTVTNLETTELTIQTNVFIQNTATFTNNIMILSNGMVFAEHVWLGPTNEITTVPIKNAIINRYEYTAYTPCAVTNFTPWSTGSFVQHAVLEILNSSGSNITITVHEPIRIPIEDTSRVYTLTNGNLMVCSMEWAPLGTNSVLRAFK